MSCTVVLRVLQGMNVLLANFHKLVDEFKKKPYNLLNNTLSHTLTHILTHTHTPSLALTHSHTDVHSHAHVRAHSVTHAQTGTSSGLGTTCSSMRRTRSTATSSSIM